MVPPASPYHALQWFRVTRKELFFNKLLVQQKLMGHAQISTTMNVYGNALMDSKRDANSRVAKLLYERV
jgi:integrase